MAGAVMTERPPHYEEDKVGHQKVQHTLWILNTEYELIFFFLVDCQLSIYPGLEREIVVVDSPSVLETQIGVVRKAVAGVARDVHRRVHGAVSDWIGIEHAVESACFYLPLCLSKVHPIFFLQFTLSRPG